ncbi:hypothetical protein TNCV_1043841 [Trichonephila clavipes]|nr:hypothetical protein TNCV_1043841 [Trichonephila clavipes]
MFRSSGQPDAKPSMFSSQASLALIYRLTEEMKSLVPTRDLSPAPVVRNAIYYHSATELRPETGYGSLDIAVSAQISSSPFDQNYKIRHRLPTLWFVARAEKNLKPKYALNLFAARLAPDVTSTREPNPTEARDVG